MEKFENDKLKYKGYNVTIKWIEKMVRTLFNYKKGKSWVKSMINVCEDKKIPF
jgi:hypothetical protein